MIDRQVRNVDHQTHQHSTTTKTYQLANIYRVLFARIFDLVISATPGIVLRALVVIHPGDWKLMLSILFASLGFILLYFVFGPYFFQGNTLGKLVFGIRLKQKGKNHVGFWPLFWRETYFMLIPWVFALICQIIAVLIMSPYANSENTGAAPATKTAIILTQIAYLFYVVWSVFVGATIKVQEHHQASVDMKFQLYAVQKQEITTQKTTKSTQTPMKREEKHVALASQPGNFSKDQVESLYISDEQELQRSLHLKKVSHLDEMVIEQKNKPKIAPKTKKEETKDD